MANYGQIWGERKGKSCRAVMDAQALVEEPL